MRAAPTIGFQYRTSPSLIVATIVVALLAIVAVWVSGLPPWLRMFSTFCVVGWTALVVTRMLTPHLRSLSWRTDGVAELVLHDRRRNLRTQAQGSVQDARVLGPLIILALRWPPRGRAAIWLLPDNLDADTRRRLRMRLGTREGNRLASGNTDRQ